MDSSHHFGISQCRGSELPFSRKDKRKQVGGQIAFRHHICFGRGKRNDMKTNSPMDSQGPSLKSIFRYMMEKGYYPQYEHTHIQFDFDGINAVVESYDGYASVRLFFEIEKDEYEFFLEASNMTMLKTYAVKPAVMDDREDIVFSYEFPCDNIRDFRKFFPRACQTLKDALEIHKNEMRKLVFASRMANATIPAREESVTGIGRKILS